jgi:hypothetical protein
MKRIFLAIAATVGLTGCVGDHMNDGLQSLVGQDIHVAVARLGYPDGQRTMLGDTIYIWSSNHSAVLPLTTTNTTTGNVGGVPVYGTQTNTNFVPMNFACTIQIATDKSGRITTWQWSGNMGGCQPYANALRR